MPTRLTIHVLEPTANHTHTAIFLHGRGDNGSDFAEELLASSISDATGAIEDQVQRSAPTPLLTLQTRFPSWRWVFPSAPDRWSETFQETFPAWFEDHSLSNTTSPIDLQVEWIRESVAEIVGILDDEVRRLGGAAQNVVLGGISQGAAVGLWALLSLLNLEPAEARSIPRLGAFVGASCWLPFGSAVETYLHRVGIDRPSQDSTLESNAVDSNITNGCSQDFIRSVLEGVRKSIASYGRDHPFLTTPVFLGHGADDAYVDVNLGRGAKAVLSGIGFGVTWKEYRGAEQEGHWFKEPEELRDIARVLSAIAIM